MDIVKKQDYKPIREHMKPGLLNHDFIEKYIREYGKPICFCCGYKTEVFMPAHYHQFIRIYCTNCALTLQAVAMCNH